MIWILIISWYLIGVISGLYFVYKIYHKISSTDLIIITTFGGIDGLITILIGWAVYSETKEINRRYGKFN